MCAKDKFSAECDDLSAPGGIRPKSKRVVYFNMLQAMKVKHNLNTTPKDVEDDNVFIYDSLAYITELARQGLGMLSCLSAKVQDTVAYRIFMNTTQPAHLILFLSVVSLAYLGSSGSSGSLSWIWSMTFLTTFAAHFGTHVWMNLVSGLVLYFNIPRKIFGDIQIVLFPAYYVFQSIMSLICLISYLKLHSVFTQTSDELIFTALQTIQFFTELSIRLFVAPRLLKLKYLKTEMEEAAGNGEEVGRIVLGELQHCPHYMKILAAFRNIHSGIAIAAMLLLSIGGYQLSHLVSSMCRV